MSGSFAEASARLAGQVAIAFGWTPDGFWAATPAEIASVVQAADGDGADGLGAGELARLMEAFPDG